MKWKRTVSFGLILLGLVVLPLLVAAYAILHLKGFPALHWPDLSSLKFDDLLSWLGIDPDHLDRLWDQLASVPGRADESGCGGGATGSSGAGGAGGGPLPWGDDPFSRGVRRGMPGSSSDVGNRVIHSRREGQKSN